MTTPDAHPPANNPGGRVVLTIRKSQWGWTAYHPNGTAVAHSRERSWLEAYVKECGL